MSRKSRGKKRRSGAGRPPAITPTVLQKLEDAFSNSYPDAEACLYAGISPSTLYSYQERHPQFTERKKALKLTPNLVARKAIVDSLTDPNQAWRWIERRDPEMRPITSIQHSGTIKLEPTMPTDPNVVEALRQYNETRKKQIAAERRQLLKK